MALKHRSSRLHIPRMQIPKSRYQARRSVTLGSVALGKVSKVNKEVSSRHHTLGVIGISRFSQRSSHVQDDASKTTSPARVRPQDALSSHKSPHTSPHRQRNHEHFNASKNSSKKRERHKPHQAQRRNLQSQRWSMANAGQASAKLRRSSSHGTHPNSNYNAPKLRLRKGLLVRFMLILPLAIALAGFSALQGKQTRWALAPFEDARRGRIIAADGTVLAEGAVGQRRYPQGVIAGHIIGFTGAKQDDGSYGLEGIEHTMDDYLQAGHDVTLTIETNLQTVAQNELRQAVLDNEAENGAVVMLEVGTGRIVAAASYPEYNLQDWQSALQQPNHPTINRAFLQQVEPGSTMKPFIVAAALQAGKVSADEIFPTPMRYRVGNKTFQDSMRHDEFLPVYDFLKYSSNSGMIQMAERFEAQEMYAWLENFGFGISPSIKFVYSREGQLNPWWAWVPQDQASTAIGQSVSVTALQLAAAYSILANDGIYIPPYLVEGSYAGDARRVLEPAISHNILAMMMEVVAYRGARVALVPGVLVAGKTGTADIYDAEAGTYIDGDYTTSFAGVFPADKPQYVVVVYVQKPRNQYRFGSTIAAPVFQRIAAETVALKGIARNPNYAHYTQGQPFEW